MPHFLQSFTLKRAILTLAGMGWLALIVSDYGLLTGRRSMHYPAELTKDNKAFVTVRCRYWFGLEGRTENLSGPPGSVSCPWLLRAERKWKS